MQAPERLIDWHFNDIDLFVGSFGAFRRAVANLRAHRSDFVLVSASGRGLMAFTNYMYKHNIVRALVTLPDDDGGAL